MQMANILCIIANKGYFYTPHVIKSIGGKPNTSRNLAEKHYTNVSAENFDIIQDGMQRVVEAGTARIARFDTITICGKTGTVQNPHGEDHSVFIAFAPMDKPKIAIAVFVENAGFGGTWAAPIASLMMEKYLRDSISRPTLEEKMFNGYLLPLLNKGPENGVMKLDSAKAKTAAAGSIRRRLHTAAAYGVVKRLHTAAYGSKQYLLDSDIWLRREQLNSLATRT